MIYIIYSLSLVKDHIFRIIDLSCFLWVFEFLFFFNGFSVNVFSPIE